MGHYGSEMGYGQPARQSDGKCPQCHGEGFVRLSDVTGRTHRAVCYDCRGTGLPAELPSVPEGRAAIPPSQTTTDKPWQFEVCRVCGRKNVAAFWVSDRMWMRVLGLDSPDGGGVLCIWCFDDMATAKGVDWTEEPPQWHPISTIANQKWGEIEQSGPFNPSGRAEEQAVVKAARDHVEWWDECAWLFDDLATEPGAVSSISALRAALDRSLSTPTEGGGA